MKTGDTADFPLTTKRGLEAAKRYSKRAINLHDLPEKVTINKSDSRTAAMKSVNADICIKLGVSKRAPHGGQRILTPLDIPPGAFTLVSRAVPLMGRKVEVAVTQNRLPSEFGKTPAIAAFKVTILAWAMIPPKISPPAMNPAAKVAMRDFCMIVSCLKTAWYCSHTGCVNYSLQDLR
jgi:hypothetical protein